MAIEAATEAGGAASIEVINPSGQRSTLPIPATPFVFGRQAENDLVLRDNRVSRVHARIVQENGGFYIEDLNSRHGTYLNTVRLQSRVRLAEDDSITFGFPDGYQLRFHLDQPEIANLAGHVVTTGPAGELSKLRALVEVARALRSSLSTQEVLESVVEAALSVTKSERGFLFLKKDDQLELMVARDRQGRKLGADELKVPARTIKRALEGRRELLSMNFDPLGDQPDMSIAALDLRSVVCLPLVRIRTQSSLDTIVSDPRDTLGLIYMDSKLDLADLSAGNREILQTLALEASTILENARLLEQDRVRQRMEDELRIARQIQQDLFPERLPDSGWFRAAASSIPSQQVGGDVYDVARIDARHWHFLVADVSGKGVSSALLAALLQGGFVLVPSEPEGVAATLSQLNRYVYERAEGEKYATLFYAALREDGRLHWCNAGHCEPFLLHTDGTMEVLGSTSLPLGLMDEVEFEVRTTQLAPGDRVVVYSDGVTDSRDRQGEVFGGTRVVEAVRRLGGATAAELHAGLIDAVVQFAGGSPQPDDITVLVAEYRP